MKKLFMFLAVASMATFGASCSSDDSSSKKTDDNPDDVKPPVAKQLVLTADATSILEGGTVKFTVKADGKEEGGAELYIGSEKISNPHTFAEAGEYKVVAKKKDFKDSTAVTIKVKKEGDPEDPKTLTLSVVGATDVFTGDDVIFAVKDAEGKNVTGVTIKTGETTVSNPWTPTEEGTFKFVASKEGYENSNEVTVVVAKKVVPTGNYITFGSSTVYNIDYSRLLANASQAEDQNWYIHTYEDEDGAEYCIFYLRVGKTEGEGFGGVSQVAMAVYQDPANPTALMYPGQGETQYINSWAVDVTGQNEVDFEFADLTVLNFPTAGPNGAGKYEVANTDAAVKFDGAYSVKTVGVIPVDANGTPIQSIAGPAKFQKDSAIKTMKLVKKLK